MATLVPERQHNFILDPDKTLLEISKHPLVRQNNLRVMFILIKIEIKASTSTSGLTPRRTNGGTYFATQNAALVNSNSKNSQKALWVYKVVEDQNPRTFIRRHRDR